MSCFKTRQRQFLKTISKRESEINLNCIVCLLKEKKKKRNNNNEEFDPGSG